MLTIHLDLDKVYRFDRRALLRMKFFQVFSKINKRSGAEVHTFQAEQAEEKASTVKKAQGAELYFSIKSYVEIYVTISTLCLTGLIFVATLHLHF